MRYQGQSPLFSIIIPTFNAVHKLELTLKSIRDQHFDELEVLVQDGGSTDGTLDYLGQQSDISVISEKDKGIYDAMNRAVARSKGRYLLFLGAGDLLLPEALSRVAGQLPTEAGLNFVYGDAVFPNGQIYGGWFSETALQRRNVCHQAIFTEKSVFERLGGFNLRYPLFADWAFNFCVWGDSQVRRTYHPIPIARYEGGGASSSGLDSNFLRDYLGLVFRHLGKRAFVRALFVNFVPLVVYMKFVRPRQKRQKEIPLHNKSDI